MKRIVAIVLPVVMLVSACRKSNSDSTDMGGSWKLISVYDKNSARLLTPPTSNMDIVLTFLSATRFAGHTFRNTLTDDTYSQNGNEINFQNFSMTKIAEDEWGGSLIAVLHACSLQSAVPCAPSNISIQGNLMFIVTPLRYDITLQKM